jgi:riboflavin-specific deaminase-like protein
VVETTVLQAIEAALAGASERRRSAARPFVTLSYAQSLDGSITGRAGGSLRLSGPAALRLTHQLRASHDAILVGIGTVLADDPRLTVRLVDGRNPQPIVVDTRLRFPLTANLLRDGQVRPWIAAGESAGADCARRLGEAGARVLTVATTPNGQVDLAALLARLAELGIRRVMVEGGARIITSFLAERLVDQIVLTVAPRLLGGQRAVGDLGDGLPGCRPRLLNVQYDQFGDDLIVRGDLGWETP